MKSYLRNHLKLLETKDYNFSELLEGRSPIRREEFFHRALMIDKTAEQNTEILNSIHAHETDRVRRQFVRVQEVGMKPLCSYSRIWLNMLYDMDHRREVDRAAHQRVESYIGYVPREAIVCWYGGLKSAESVAKKFKGNRIPDQIREFVIPFWDLVRYRIVVPSLQALLDLSVSIWMHDIDYISRCRNYYFNPRSRYHQDPYRAVHFVINIDNLGLFELQIVTSSREISSVLDQRFTFKEEFQFLNQEHIDWLIRFQLAANILDSQECEWELCI